MGRISIRSHRPSSIAVMETLRVNGEALSAGDAAVVSDEAALTIAADQDAEFLLFDLV